MRLGLTAPAAGRACCPTVCQGSSPRAEGTKVYPEGQPSSAGQAAHQQRRATAKAASWHNESHVFSHGNVSVSGEKQPLQHTPHFKHTIYLSSLCVEHIHTYFDICANMDQILGGQTLAAWRGRPQASALSC